MSDTRELLRPGVDGFEPTPDAFERVLARRDRKRRHQRIAAGFVGAAVFALVALWFLRSLSSAPTPAVPRPEPEPPRNGEWVVISVSSLDPGAPPMSRGKPANLFVAGPGGSARLLAGAEVTPRCRCVPRSPRTDPCSPLARPVPTRRRSS